MKTEKYQAGEKLLVYFLCVIVGFVIMFIVMLLFAALSVALDLSEGFSVPFVSLAAAAGGVISSFLSSKKLKSGGMLNGVICGGIMFLTILIVSLIIDDTGLSLNTLFNFIIIMLSALIGGVWGVNRRTKKII